MPESITLSFSGPKDKINAIKNLDANSKDYKDMVNTLTNELLPSIRSVAKDDNITAKIMLGGNNNNQNQQGGVRKSKKSKKSAKKSAKKSLRRRR